MRQLSISTNRYKTWRASWSRRTKKLADSIKSYPYFKKHNPPQRDNAFLSKPPKWALSPILETTSLTTIVSKLTIRMLSMIRTSTNRSAWATSTISVSFSKEQLKLKSFRLLWRWIRIQVRSPISMIRGGRPTLAASQLLRTTITNIVLLITADSSRKKATTSSTSTKTTPSRTNDLQWSTQSINSFKSSTSSPIRNQSERSSREASSRSKTLASSSFSRLKRALVATILQPFDIYSLLSIWTFRPKRQTCWPASQQRPKRPTLSWTATFPRWWSSGTGLHLSWTVSCTTS